jgi:hypothetical protein
MKNSTIEVMAQFQSQYLHTNIKCQSSTIKWNWIPQTFHLIWRFTFEPNRCPTRSGTASVWMIQFIGWRNYHLHG